MSRKIWKEWIDRHLPSYVKEGRSNPDLSGMKPCRGAARAERRRKIRELLRAR